MKIIDKETGKRVVGKPAKLDKRLKDADPIKRLVDKELDSSEYSPMDPPDAYDKDLSKINYESMSESLRDFMDEHKELEKVVDAFEKSLAEFKENGYNFTDQINATFTKFFEFFDDELLTHNIKEEKHLFPLLHKLLLDSGEHGTGKNPKTSVDLMEDDHMKFIQLGTLVFNFLGLSSRIADTKSRLFILDTAYNNARELAELIKLHIYREDNIVFPLAQKLMTSEQLEEVYALMHGKNSCC